MGISLLKPLYEINGIVIPVPNAIDAISIPVIIGLVAVIVELVLNIDLKLHHYIMIVLSLFALSKSFGLFLILRSGQQCIDFANSSNSLFSLLLGAGVLFGSWKLINIIPTKFKRK